MPRIVAVTNLTGDSRVAESVATTRERAVARGVAQHLAGAHIIEIGARSTNPGAPSPTERDEEQLLLSTLAALQQEGLHVCVETWSTAPAIAAAENGAAYIDFTAGAVPDSLFDAAAANGATLILLYLPYPDPAAMHGLPAVAWNSADAAARLEELVERATRRGVKQVVIDPNTGILHPSLDDYAKIAQQAAVVRLVPRLRALAPVLVYCPRKEALTSRIIMADLILESGVDYVRVHEPQTIFRAAAARRLLTRGTP